MVAWERYMVAARDADWVDNYINYGGLKVTLAESVQRQKLTATLRKRGLTPSASQDFSATMASMDLSVGASAMGASLGATGAGGFDDIFSKVNNTGSVW